MSASHVADEFSVLPYCTVDCDELYELSKMKCKGNKDCKAIRDQAKSDYNQYCKYNVALPLFLELFLLLSFILISYSFFYKSHHFDVFRMLKFACQ